jgi:predicted transcriptional regulator
MEKKLLELAVELVQSQASINKMSCAEIESALLRVYNALYRMQVAEVEGRSVRMNGRGEEENNPSMSESQEKIDPHASIQEDKVICLECGAEFRQLTANHLLAHQLSPRDYKKKWGFPLKQPLAAKSLTKLRSRSAKKRGLPENLQRYLEDQRQKKESDRRGDSYDASKPSSRQSAGRHTA